MDQIDFSTNEDLKTLASEVVCMKALMTLMLKAIGQADAGKVIINLERYIAEEKDEQQAEVFRNTLKQIKHAFRQ